jgi:apolipoprotein N-acyltransferase
VEIEVVRRWVRARGVAVLAGTTLRDVNAQGEPVARNDAVWFGVDGRILRRGKVRPVPFGERAPFTSTLPWLQTFAPRPMVEPAKVGGPMTVRIGESDVVLGTAICFETSFPRPTLDAARGAQVLAILTNDEWFGATEAPRQHAAMGVLRAVEANLPLAQAANGGRSFAVDRFGRFLREDLKTGFTTRFEEGMAPVGEEAVVAVRLPLR